MSGITKIKSMYYDDKRDISRYDIYVSDDAQNEFTIFFGGNLDLYFISKHNVKQYYINKKNKFAYDTFSKLYDDLKKIETGRDSQMFCSASQLFEGNTFFWYSEDAPLDDADRLTIEKDKNNIIINFEENPNLGYNKRNISIRFTNSGSRNQYVVRRFMELRKYLLEMLPNPDEILTK